MATGRLGQTVRRLREAAGLTQAQLAKRIGVTDAYVGIIDRGKKRSPLLSVPRRLAKTLGVSVTELLR